MERQARSERVVVEARDKVDDTGKRASERSLEWEADGRPREVAVGTPVAGEGGGGPPPGRPFLFFFFWCWCCSHCKAYDGCAASTADGVEAEEADRIAVVVPFKPYEAEEVEERAILEGSFFPVGVAMVTHAWDRVHASTRGSVFFRSCRRVGVSQTGGVKEEEEAEVEDTGEMKGECALVARSFECCHSQRSSVGIVFSSSVWVEGTISPDRCAACRSHTPSSLFFVVLCCASSSFPISMPNQKGGAQSCVTIDGGKRDTTS